MSVELLNIIIAFIALIISLITAIIQIKTQLAQMRPYLSFRCTEIKYFNESSTLDFNLVLDNVGKCVLLYEVKNLEIYISGVKQNDVDEHSRGSVIGVNATGFFNRHYKYQYSFTPDGTIILPNCKILFEIQYNKINEKKRYKMNYEIEIENGRSFINKSSAT